MVNLFCARLKVIARPAKTSSPIEPSIFGTFGGMNFIRSNTPEIGAPKR